ncbi:MAG: ATP-binding protein [Acidobacteriia bacterium]|nr:ATP-binding protein [Terriglobia bacterium]
MIQKRLDDITEQVLAALISNGVREGRTIDYKRGLPGSTDADKKEFLADASSFANTATGDLVFGMDEDQGLPTQVTGIQTADLDLEIRRLESILAAGLSPRIRYAIKVVSVANGQVLVMRVERGWTGPHRVIFQGHDKFYGRNSAGKYPLDVNELRTAFTLSGTAIERIRAFRTDRIIALANNETPIPFVEDPKIVLHCIPVDSFASQTQYDILPFYEGPMRLQPMGTTSWDLRLNLEGVLAFGRHQPAHTYTQLYRTGVIEVVNAYALAMKHRGRVVIHSIAYEQNVFKYLPRCFQYLRELGCTAPVAVALSLIKTRGLEMAVDDFDIERGYPINSDTIILPETLVEDLLTPIGKILKPLFDLVWNACGFPSSRNFDSEGNWIDRQ